MGVETMKRIILFLFLLVPAVGFATAQQVDFLAAGMTDSSGLPLASGLVYTYSSGTTASKTTWLDTNKATARTNPIVLDARGRALVFADGRYKFVVKNSVGVTQYTFDGLEYSSVLTFASDTTDPFGAILTQTNLIVASLTATLSANLNANNYKVTALATPSADGDAVNKGYLGTVAPPARILVADFSTIFTTTTAADGTFSFASLASYSYTNSSSASMAVIVSFNMFVASTSASVSGAIWINSNADSNGIPGSYALASGTDRNVHLFGVDLVPASTTRQYFVAGDLGSDAGCRATVIHDPSLVEVGVITALEDW